MRLVEGDDAVLRVVYKALMEVPEERDMAVEHGVTEDVFLTRWRGARCVGFEVAGCLAGGMFFSEGRIHIGVLRAYRSRWLKLLPQALEVGFKLFGTLLLAPVSSCNQMARRFVEQVGCELLSDDGKIALYEVRRAKMRYRKVR